MDSLIDRLQQQTDEADLAGLDPSQHLGAVMQRGRRYRAVATTLGAVGATVVLAGGALALPQVVELLEGPVQPTVAATPDGEDVPEDELVVEEPATPDEEPTQPAVEAPAPEDAEEPDPGAAEVIDTVAPVLEVLEPADGEVVTSSKVTFSGTTEPGARVTVGEYEATVDEEGRWSILLIASEGGNEVTFAATDAAGNTTTATTAVTYSPPAGSKEKVASPPADSTLTASQQSGVLETAPYKNVYWGTAAPGAKVAVLSDYGSGYVYADDAGQWEVRVDFSPPGGTVTFPVTVKLYEQPEVRRTFELTTTAEQGSLTASQQSGVLEAAPHKNVYWGTATPGAKVAALSDYGSGYVYADEAGQWETYVDFDPPAGEKTFTVTVKLYHQPEVRTTFQLTTVAEEVAAFTATQQAGTVSASAPTNTYSGTGEPGHEVWIWTDGHGEAFTTIGADGTWSLDVTYTAVAPGDVFAAKAKDLTTGAKHLFEVTVTE